MESSAFRKVADAAKLGIILGVVLGIGRVVLFLCLENYNLEELRPTLINFLSSRINSSTIAAVSVCVSFGVIWTFYDRLQGWLLASLASGILILPIAYYINKNFLPGIRAFESIVGNAILALLAGVLAWLIHRQWSRKVQFIERIGKKYVVLTVLLILAGVNLVYRLQPQHLRLRRISDTPNELIKLLDRSTLAGAFPKSNGQKLDTRAPEQTLKWYFEQKTSNRIERLRKKIALQDSVKIVANADSILRRSFTFVGMSRKLPQDIDWRSNPTNDKVWVFALNRHEWLWDLAAAYLLTKEPKYANTFEEIMEDWFEENPMPDWKNESDPAWRLMESSLRMTSCWLDAFNIFFSSSEVSDQLKWRMLASFYEHAQFLMHFRSPGRNHLLQETFGLFAIAGVFPEFKRSDEWLKIANLRLNRVLKSEIYPDGGYKELSTFYHRFVVRILQQIADFAAENGTELSNFFYEQLEKMYSFLLYVSKPDGVMPQINDGFHAKNLRVLFAKPARRFNRADFEYFATEGRLGREPARTSMGFPYSGIYVMRSDWSERAKYMIVDAGLYGSAHGHEDKLSFELFAFGKPFIIESGTYTYNYNRWHRYFESSFAHNTIVVDSRSQLRQPYSERWTNDPPKERSNVWVVTENLEYFEAKYDQGYGNQKENVLRNVEHVRRILFVKPDYWILWDTVEGEGNHSVSQLFHLPPEPLVETDNENDVLISYADGPLLLIKSLHPESGSLTMIEGDQSPIQGWVSPKYGVKLKAPVLDFKKLGGVPLVFINALVPFPNSADLEKFRLQSVPVHGGKERIELSEAIAVKVETENWSDVVMIAPFISGEKDFDGFTSTAEISVIRRFPDGGIRKAQVESLTLSHE